MSSRRAETREDILKQLYDNKFGNLSEDIQEVIEEIIQKQEEEDAKKQLKELILSMSKYRNDSSLINKDIRTNKTNINNKDMNYNTNGGYYNNSKHTNMNMKNIKDMCKAHQIKLSRVVNEKRIVYNKRELLTKLKRKKII